MVKRSTTSVCLSIVRGKEKEVTFKVKSHGNTKDKRKPSLPTRKTILKEMKSQESRKETPKVTLQHITRNAGGVMSAESSGSVPRGRQQIYDTLIWESDWCEIHTLILWSNWCKQHAN